jgi:Heterokaryon incompatibility protein (HET)
MAQVMARQTLKPPIHFDHKPLNCYEYSTLDPSKTEIRLLLLNPGGRTAQLSARIHTVSLDDGPVEYEAVSYTWARQNGDSSLSSTITVDLEGSVVWISATCKRALRRLRHVTKTRTLWIDMICINQSNFGERNHQVSQMKRIYSSSTCVLIDVGYSRAGVEVLDYLGLHPEKFEQKYGSKNPGFTAFRALFSRRW